MVGNCVAHSDGPFSFGLDTVCSVLRILTVSIHSASGYRPTEPQECIVGVVHPNKNPGAAENLTIRSVRDRVEYTQHTSKPRQIVEISATEITTNSEAYIHVEISAGKGSNLLEVDPSSFVYRTIQDCQLVDLLLRLRPPKSNREIVTRSGATC